jgi:hypothetical protein
MKLSQKFNIHSPSCPHLSQGMGERSLSKKRLYLYIFSSSLSLSRIHTRDYVFHTCVRVWAGCEVCLGNNHISITRRHRLHTSPQDGVCGVRARQVDLRRLCRQAAPGAKQGRAGMVPSRQPPL